MIFLTVPLIPPVIPPPPGPFHIKTEPADGLISAMYRRSSMVIPLYNDLGALPILGIVRFIHMFVGMHAPMPVMVVMSEDLMEKYPEAVLLRIVKTIV